MKKINKFRLFKNFIFFLLLATISTTLQYDGKREINYKIVNSLEYDYYGTYSLGKVYIGNHKFIYDLIGKVEDNDILIVDIRNSDDPDMQVLSSFEVNDPIIQSEIISIMMNYEKRNPSNWERSSRSMKVEWFVHNFLYDVNYQKSHTTDVDFNNKDEKRYDIEYQLKKRIKKILGR